MMRRRMGCLLLIMLLCVGSAQAEENGESRNVYFSDGEMAYCLSDGGLWKLDEALQPTGKLCDTEAVAGFADEQGVALAVPMEAGYRFERVDGDVLFEVESERVLRDFVISGDCLAALWQYRAEEGLEHGEEGLLTAYHLDGQEMRAPCRAAAAIAPAGDGNIWVSEYEQGSFLYLYRWTPDSDETRMLLDRGSVSAVCAASGTVAYVSDGGVYLLDDSGSGRRLGDVQKYALVKLFARGTQLMAYCVEGEPEMETFDLAQASDAEHVLTVVNCANWNDERMRAATAMLEAEHPDVEVQFVDMDYEQLNTALLAAEPGLDVLYLSNFEAITYVDAGMLVDLNQSPEVMAQLEHWIPVEGMTTWNGMRFGVQMGTFLHLLSVNESLREYLPEDLNVDQLSWKELLTAGAEFQGDIDGDGQRDYWLLYDSRRFPTFLYQYILSAEDIASLEFDTPEFRELMELYRACDQCGSIADDGSEESSRGTSAFAVEVVSNPDTSVHAPLPSLDDGPAAVGSVFAMGVNRASQQQELALELLADYASVDVQRLAENGYDVGYERNYYFSPLKDSSAHELYAELTPSEKERLEINKELFSEGRMIWFAREFNGYCGDQVEAYLDGEIALDELISNLQQRKQMVLMG